MRCKAYVVAPCGEVRGDEEGYWRAEQDGTYTWHLQACVLRRFSHEDARQCLRNRHLLIVGDSVSRYQYLSLTSLQINE